MKEVIDLFKPSIKKHPMLWFLVVVITYYLYYAIPPIAVATGNQLVKVFFEEKGDNKGSSVKVGENVYDS